MCGWMVTHYKMLIIDGEVVVSGSYYFNKSARMHYDENTLIVRSPEIGVGYLEEFERLWGLATGLDAEWRDGSLFLDFPSL